MTRLTLILASAAVAAQIACGQAAPAWVTMVDPQEHAFSIDVPRGWKAYGGMFRASAVDVKPFVDMASPDGAIDIRVGDASIPSYDLPSPTLQRLQQRYRAPGAAGQFVAPYASGDRFAAHYGLSRFGSMCQNVQVSRTGQAQPTLGTGAYGTHITAGWAGFTCAQNGRRLDAYVYAETLEVLPTPGSAGKWYVVVLGSVIAPEARAKEAGDLLLHSYKSVALNPVWKQEQAQRIKAATGAVVAGSQWSTSVYNHALSSYQQNMKLQAREVDNFNDIQLGQTYAVGTNGQTYVVPSGKGGAQWIDPLNAVKESPLTPGSGFTQLTPISR
ncbi:MAG TPA: hypothetical protein VHW09_27515 [Bryobacteraceae bacterium]|jgi:hypothetical protein|nr:hypothetical protein [Bryobacteraceae bacterium]